MRAFEQRKGIVTRQGCLFVSLPILVIGGTVGCSSWDLTSAAGRRCVVNKGQATSEVFEACGLPDASATQPKAFSRGKSILEPVACSAPAYIYGSDAVVLDCNGKVAGVEAADGPGLVPDQPREYHDPDPAATRRQKERQPAESEPKDSGSRTPRHGAGERER